MNKKELIDLIAERGNFDSAGEAENAMVATFDAIRSAMVNNDTVKIPEVGTFGTKVRAARKGRNPSTGAEINIPESTVPYFKPATKLKEEVNQ